MLRRALTYSSTLKHRSRRFMCRYRRCRRFQRLFAYFKCTLAASVFLWFGQARKSGSLDPPVGRLQWKRAKDFDLSEQIQYPNPICLRDEICNRLVVCKGRQNKQGNTKAFESFEKDSVQQRCANRNILTNITSRLDRGTLQLSDNLPRLLVAVPVVNAWQDDVHYEAACASSKKCTVTSHLAQENKFALFTVQRMEEMFY